MNDLEVVCKDCGKIFVITAEKQERYNKIKEENPEFQLPKRCYNCIQIKKRKFADKQA